MKSEFKGLPNITVEPKDCWACITVDDGVLTLQSTAITDPGFGNNIYFTKFIYQIKLNEKIKKIKFLKHSSSSYADGIVCEVNDQKIEPYQKENVGAL